MDRVFLSAEVFVVSNFTNTARSSPLPDLIGLPLQTMFAGAEQRSLDAEFDETYPENGSFSKRERNGQQYWDYNGDDRQTGAKHVKYAGPAQDEAVTQRVERFQRIKTDFCARAA